MGVYSQYVLFLNRMHYTGQWVNQRVLDSLRYQVLLTFYLYQSLTQVFIPSRIPKIQQLIRAVNQLDVTSEASIIDKDESGSNVYMYFMQ